MSNDWAGTNLTSWENSGDRDLWHKKPRPHARRFYPIQFHFSLKTPRRSNLKSKISLHSLLKGIINVELHGLAGSTIIKITDINGKQIQEKISVDQQSVQLNRQVGPGVYLVKIINGQRAFDRKFFIR